MLIIKLINNLYLYIILFILLLPLYKIKRKINILIKHKKIIKNILL
jgi:hypothetical protein